MKTYLPAIRVDRFLLREIEEADFLDYYEIGKDLETTKYLNWGPFIYPNEALAVIRDIFLQRPKYQLPVGYAIVYRNQMIGVIDFHTYYPDRNTAEIGYVLHRKYWNKGIMKKCLMAVTKIGFEHLELDKIIVGHSLENEASKHVILACGYRYEYQKIVMLKEKDTIGYYYAMYRYEYERRV